MKRMIAKIVPHIVPELKLLFTRMIPLALIICWIFILFTDAQYQIRNDFKVILYGFLLTLAGLYLCRITAFVIKRILTSNHQVIPDIYYDESKNPKAA